MSLPLPADTVQAVRHFNRFYTRQLGLLDEVLLDTGFTLTEARLLYELAHGPQLNASQLCKSLGLDAGYLSRLLKKFEAQGLLQRHPHPEDARQTWLSLTDEGRRAYAPLNLASQTQVGQWLTPLTTGERTDLLQAMRTLEQLLDHAGDRPPPAVVLRPLQVGDLGWIIHRQAVLYAQEYGWGASFEALVAEIAAKYQQTHDPAWENAWVAERGGRIVGSVFLVRESDTAAKLRLLYVEPEARGLGLGQQLTDTCIAFARAKGYAVLNLWTNDVLLAARRIYQRAGFVCVAREAHHSFGHELVGEHWSLKL